MPYFKSEIIPQKIELSYCYFSTILKHFYFFYYFLLLPTQISPIPKFVFLFFCFSLWFRSHKKKKKFYGYSITDPRSLFCFSLWFGCHGSQKFYFFFFSLWFGFLKSTEKINNELNLYSPLAMFLHFLFVLRCM